eukprot:scaffold3887_cov269-Prasinococcus_capsulatus_cf.AAC.2
MARAGGEDEPDGGLRGAVPLLARLLPHAAAQRGPRPLLAGRARGRPRRAAGHRPRPGPAGASDDSGGGDGGVTGDRLIGGRSGRCTRTAAPRWWRPSSWAACCRATPPPTTRERGRARAALEVADGGS